MVPHKLLLSMFGLIILASCAPAATPTPRVVVVTQEVVVTYQVETPTPTLLVVTPTSPPTDTPAPATPSPAARSHDWTDYGGICLRPDNLPPGTAVNPDMAALESARLQILQSLWRVIDLSGSAAELTPGFSTSERFVQGVLSDVALRGPFVPVGKTPPRSDPWSFYLGDATELWREAHPGEKFNGIALDVICFELFDPFEFEDQKKLPGNPDYVHMVGGVTHAIFAMEQVFGAPRLVVKLYKDPYGKKKATLTCWVLPRRTLPSRTPWLRTSTSARSSPR